MYAAVVDCPRRARRVSRINKPLDEGEQEDSWRRQTEIVRRTRCTGGGVTLHRDRADGRTMRAYV